MTQQHENLPREDEAEADLDMVGESAKMPAEGVDEDKTLWDWEKFFDAVEERARDLLAYTERGRAAARQALEEEQLRRQAEHEDF